MHDTSGFGATYRFSLLLFLHLLILGMVNRALDSKPVELGAGFGNGLVLGRGDGLVMGRRGDGVVMGRGNGDLLLVLKVSDLLPTSPPRPPPCPRLVIYQYKYIPRLAAALQSACPSVRTGLRWSRVRRWPGQSGQHRPHVQLRTAIYLAGV